MNRWLAGHVCWPLTERLCGRDTMRRVRQLLRTQHDSPRELRDLQAAKLRRLLKSAAAHCPFYARRFHDAQLDVNDSRDRLDDLQQLPTLTRGDVREHLAEMTWRGCPGGAWPYSTGGSSGEPLRFYIDRFRSAADAAARWRARSWWHVAPGDDEVLLWGAPIELHRNDRIRQWRDTLLNQHLLNAFDMTARNMDAFVQHLRVHPPVCLYGYASSLTLLSRHANAQGLPPGSLGSKRLKAVFVTGEVLLDHDREAIGSVFGAPVVIEYGSRDGGFTALACEAGQLHVAQENVILELLDPQGRPVEPGEVGEVTITHLEAFATPLIRYRLGDLARWSTCSCGRTLPALAEVRGRVTDQIVCRHQGQLRHMHALSLMYVLREAEGLNQFRITQPSLDRLEVEIVSNERFTPQTQCAIEQGLRRRMGDGVAIEILRRDRILPTASGKHACVVSHVPAHQETC